MNLFPSQLNFLIKMKNTLAEEFNLDQLDIINAYLKKTGLRSKIIYKWLENDRRQALRRSEAPEFRLVRRQFITYLDKKITTLRASILKNQESSHSSTPHSSQASSLERDIWRAQFEESSKNSAGLLEASMHIQDLLFACNQIVKNLHTQAHLLVEKELKPFIEEALPSYLELFPSLSKRLKTEIYASVVELKELIAQEDFQRAEAQLCLIQSQIRAN
ncbi:hypothetical protein [Parachlamydia sp. AcF125]|uniref:hypothetical protein n=1 Tax=Parachlamydia sp. AcF125 TaxID=2795736 RepID=UPI001BCA061B|nr:hypothetical protein [Parachlamydia sp. AcF125]MBS4168312.1 hypothetical protein [Parachlamydia sp. AcF125]